MSQEDVKKIGLLYGREKDWPEALMEAIEEKDALTAEEVKLGGTFMNDSSPYTLIIDRMSHRIPYYRTYLKYAALHGAYIINNPFTWSADNRFFGIILAHKLGYKCARTIALPNKETEQVLVPESFRNLKYPMDWEGIVDYVGVPAIFKDVRSGGRGTVNRVHSVEELIQYFDGSGNNTMILQQVIKSDYHVHAFVVDQKVQLLRYSPDEEKYYSDSIDQEGESEKYMVEAARSLTDAYNYDINMVEFVIKDDEPYVINATNPAPIINSTMMNKEQFEWLVQAGVELALDRCANPLPQRVILDLSHEN